MLVSEICADRLSAARQHLQACALCEHRCLANRSAGETGPCRAGVTARVFRQRVEYGEEIELIPSHLFYLSGCDLRCRFCIAEANAFNPQIGTPLTSQFLESALADARVHRPRTLQWVGGEPTIHLPAIVQAMSEVKHLPPIVWKSNFCGTQQAFTLLDGIAETFVADFKFGNDACAKRLANAERYWGTVTRNLLLANKLGNLIVRHLVMPGHLECCFQPVVRWIAKWLPDVKFSLRDGYLPRWLAHHDSDLSRPLDAATARLARAAAERVGLNLVN
jgi:putative pyruvate formate lyase activating enzyme